MSLPYSVSPLAAGPPQAPGRRNPRSRKVASGGLRSTRATRPRTSPYASRDFSLFRRQVRRDAALAQTNPDWGEQAASDSYPAFDVNDVGIALTGVELSPVPFESSQTNSYFDTANQLNWQVGLFGALIEKNAAAFARLGAPAAKVAEFGERMGIAGILIGVALDENNPDVGKIHMGINAGVSVFGMTGVGLAPALMYGFTDAYYPGGTPQFAHDYFIGNRPVGFENNFFYK